MATINGTITSGTNTGETFSAEIPTIRVSELPQGDLPFDPNDQFPFQDASQGKLSWIGAANLLPYLNGGGGSPVTPVITGRTVEVVVSSGQAGSYIVNVPELAGLTFALQQRGFDRFLASEFSILPSGGWSFTDHTNTVEAGQVFFADVYEFASAGSGGGTGGGTTTQAVSILTGIAIISSSTTLATAHWNKLIHVAGSSIVVTLPDIADAPDNIIIPIETTIGNSKKTRVTTTASQNIYFANTSNTSVYLGISEFIWLLKGSDGWYVINASQGLLAVGETFFGYKAGLNTIPCDGQQISRADEPRLWAFAQTLGSSLVSEINWLAGQKGFFSPGNGSTTFRVPDLRNQFIRGLKTLSGSDAERTNNIPGGLQAENINTTSGIKAVKPAVGNTSTDGVDAATGGGEIDVTQWYPLTAGSGTETIPANVGLIPLIRT